MNNYKMVSQMDKKDFTFTYDYYGYMIYYKNKPIGGAGVLNREGRKLKSNLSFYKERANHTIFDIVHGRIERRFKEAINKIEWGVA